MQPVCFQVEEALSPVKPLGEGQQVLGVGSQTVISRNDKGLRFVTESNFTYTVGYIFTTLPSQYCYHPLHYK